MKIIFTNHAKEKLKTAEAKAIGIVRKKIVNTIKQPITVDNALNPHRSMGKLTEALSL